MNKLNTAVTLLVAALIGFSAYALITLISAFLVTLFWNNSVPVIFHLPTITYWQAWFLNMLCVVLFKDTSSVVTKKD
jgi:hypothetical protein